MAYAFVFLVAVGVGVAVYVTTVRSSRPVAQGFGPAGEPASPADLREASDAVGLPVLVGSGLTPANLAEYAAADGFIVGSSLKRGGSWAQPLDADAVRAMHAAFAALPAPRA